MKWTSSSSLLVQSLRGFFKLLQFLCLLHWHMAYTWLIHDYTVPNNLPGLFTLYTTIILNSKLYRIAGHCCPESWCLHGRRRVHEDSSHQHRPSVFLCTASDPQCATSSSSARFTHAGPNTCHHQVGPMQFSSCGYLGISAGPTAVCAECCRSACLLASDIGTHDSTAPRTALVTRTGANPVLVVCPGVTLIHVGL